MIRIVREENPNRLDERSKSTLALLGVAISSNPKLFKQLLDKYGIQVPTSDKISLANGIIEGLAQQSKSFNQELSILISQVMQEEASFTADDESNYVQAIAGAIAGISGAVGNIVGGRNKQKLAKEEARREMLNNMIAMKAQEQQAVSDQKKMESKKQLYLVVGGLALVATLGFFYFRHQQNSLKTNIN
ncbi:hypothetical protein [Siansivirga zeaxanthinifaciens]|mgnify:CR=1 FL=1|uniref:Uncharacterized protein n=1 Tax=Siansivirga zeaxanthinifaciens CC-SAMT-1 TaxID=1454006 RepID=A0A0C5WPL7_9FLAO|nr:hypothetical protein [Siansivirga zeaxanthinifaciens]AJR04870.1 hypothetical protein AW14_07940 [Siansivirga zeaxanthinifaciens CC-SAMT-1]